MEEGPTGSASPDSPEAILDALREHREWGEDIQEAQLARMVERFPVDRLLEAVRSRFRRLGGADGEAILRVVEAYATPGLLEALAEALVDQPGLAPERAWGALTLLEGAGMLEDYPILAERWEDLNESLEEDDSLETLVEQLEEEPEGSWVALQGLGSVEPEVRAEIIGGLADFPTGPGLVSFLRLLAFAHEPRTRDAALATLGTRDDPEHRAAWGEIAHDHPSAEVRDRARRRLGPDAEAAIAHALGRPSRARPEPVGDLVTAPDGRGRSTIVVASRDRGRWVVASFTCDVASGIVEVYGQVGDDPAAASVVFEEIAADRRRDIVEDAPGLAPGLLAGSLLLCGPETNPALRYWLERTVGPGFRARPFAEYLEDQNIGAHPMAEMAEPSRRILDACPDWVDASPMTFDLAEEIALRAIDDGPDPRRDAGAYRYLFEHRLVGRLEHYRRMLLWMAAFWASSGDPDLARSAMLLSWQLADPQHAVPSHPFTVELSTRSLRAARENLGSALDPRHR